MMHACSHNYLPGFNRPPNDFNGSRAGKGPIFAIYMHGLDAILVSLNQCFRSASWKNTRCCDSIKYVSIILDAAIASNMLHYEN